MRVLFFGNHTVGVRTLDELRRGAEVAAVVAHPPDPEDGAVYKSVYEAARAAGIPAIRSEGKHPDLPAFIAAHAPDLLWITDFRYLLPQSVIDMAPLGAVNLHPSLLPRYRGRAPINWAILHGEEELGLSAHFVDSGMDTGDIIAQERYHLRQDQDVGHALDMLYPLYQRLARVVLGHFTAGRVPRTPQDHTQATAFPRRRPQDGALDFSRPAREVLNLVRAVARPYPGAFGTVAGRPVHVWRASLEAGTPQPDAAPGLVLPDDGQGPRVQCADGPLRLIEVDASALPGGLLAPGAVFEPHQSATTKEQP